MLFDREINNKDPNPGVKYQQQHEAYHRVQDAHI